MGETPWAPCCSPKGKNHSLVLGLRAQAGGEAQLHVVVNKSPNFSKSLFSHLPNVGPHLAGPREDDMLKCPHRAGAQPKTLLSTGAVS